MGVGFEAWRPDRDAPSAGAEAAVRLPAGRYVPYRDRVSAPPAPPPPTGPPPPNRWQRARARWADRHALPRFGFWLLTSGATVIGVCALLYVLNGFVTGWTLAYEVMTGITSPADDTVRSPWCAWPLCLAGWAVVPAVIGAAAGYVITEQIQAHHARQLGDVLDELRRLAEQPGSPPGSSGSGQ